MSSTLVELGDDRQAVRAAIARLHLTAIMFEVGARPHSPRDLYRSYLQQSDVFVGIYWQKYGWVAPGETVSGLEDEYALSGDRPKLIYVKAASAREPRLTGLLDRIRADDAVSYKPYDSAGDLGELLAEDLARRRHPDEHLRRSRLRPRRHRAGRRIRRGPDLSNHRSARQSVW